MWNTALDYHTSSSGYNSANNTSNSFFGNSFSENEIKMNDANFSQFQHQLAMSLTGGFPFIHQGISASPSSIENTPQMRAKKKPNPVPTEKKTQAYFERRKKNNQSAQKSRNERRRREQENMVRINQLEQENGVLRTMIQQLQSKLNFQELHLQSVQNAHASGSANAVTEMERRQASTCSNAGTQIPFANQMNMLMNPY